MVKVAGLSELRPPGRKRIIHESLRAFGVRLVAGDNPDIFLYFKRLVEVLRAHTFGSLWAQCECHSLNFSP
jgi:hypothetical protein